MVLEICTGDRVLEIGCWRCGGGDCSACVCAGAGGAPVIVMLHCAGMSITDHIEAVGAVAKAFFLPPHRVIFTACV